MDKQFQRLLELAKKKDAGTITPREEKRLDKITYRYITKCHEQMQSYQTQIIKLNSQLSQSTILLNEADKTLKRTFQFLKDKGLLEELKVLNEKTQ